MDHDQQRRLEIVVNGQPTHVSARSEARLGSVIAPALEQTGNVGQPPEAWELRDAHGALLDLDQEIDSFHFHHDARLFLSLKAGVGG